MEEVKTITAAEIEQKLKAGETLFLVDVREHEEVAYGKIPEAVHIPMGEIPSKLESFDKDHEYIFVCRSGVRSENVCRYLNSHGYQTVNMVGGMLAYEGETE